MAAVCFGTSPLGSMPDTYGYEVSEAQARDAINAMFDLNPSFIDTSRNYGMGESERSDDPLRPLLPLGTALSRHCAPPLGRDCR